MSRKKIQSTENVTTGATVRVPWSVIDSQAFTGASFSAKALLIDLVRQSNGFNNGRMQACYAWLNQRGWSSKATIWKAAAELTERGLIVRTRQGGLKAGASWYACTWLDIADFKGLDITRQQYHSGAWRLLDKPPTIGDGLVLKSGARNPLPTQKMGR